MLNTDRLATAILIGLAFALALLFSTPASAFQKGTLEFDYCVQIHMEYVYWQFGPQLADNEYVWGTNPNDAERDPQYAAHKNMRQRLNATFLPLYNRKCAMDERTAMADVPRHLWPSAIKP